MLNDEEREELELARSILKSEALMWLIVGANHPEEHRRLLGPVYAQYREKYGTWGQPRKKT